MRPMIARLRPAGGVISDLVLCPGCHRRLSCELAAEEVSFLEAPPEHGGPGHWDDDQGPARPSC